MGRRRMREFLGRRFARDYFLGLHVTLGALVTLLTVGLFAALTVQVTSPFPPRYDDELGRWLESHRLESPSSRFTSLGVTQAGSVAAMSAVAVLCSVFLWRRRLPALAVACLLVPAIGGALDLGLKTLVARSRPEFKDAAISEHNKSFPSGHSMGSLIGYGFVAYCCVLFVRRPGLRFAAAGCLAVLVLLIGFSRVYLGAHFLSDVLGGFALGTAWLAACVTTLEALRRRPKPEAVASGERL